MGNYIDRTVVGGKEIQNSAFDPDSLTSTASDTAQNTATQATSDATNTATQATSDATNAATNAASDASNAVSNAASDASNAVSKLAGDSSNPFSFTSFMKKLPQPKFTDPGVDPAYNLKLPKPNVASGNDDVARARMKSVNISDDNTGDQLQPMRDFMKQSGGKLTPSQVKAAQNATSDATADATNAASDATNTATHAASNITNAASDATNATNAATSAASDATNAAKNLVSSQARDALSMSKSALSATETGDSALDVVGQVAESSGILDAIPGVAEAAFIAGSLFAIGDGLYHLFHHSHHDAPPPAPVTMSGNVLQQQLTSKYASALPSMDSANDHATNMF